MSSKYRADHVGSLLRPAAVLAAIADATDPSGVIDAAILEALAAQRSAGLPIFTDGEFRRTGFLGGLIDAVEGFERGEPVVIAWKGGTGEEPAQATNSRIVSRRLSVRCRIAAHEAAFMREHSPGPFKITLPNAGAFALTGWDDERSAQAYPTRDDLVDHTGDLLAAEARELVGDGATYIQIDAPGYTLWSDPTHAHRWAARGVDLDSLFDNVMRADNRIFAAAHAAGAITACHVCRGNNMGRWMAEGGYDPIAERLFNTLNCSRLLLEYDTGNSGSFEPLRFVPDDKIVVLGLVSTKTGRLESRDDVLRRIDEATRFVPIDRLALSPQCGFASTAAGNPLTADDQWRKLEMVVSIADEVWNGSDK